jgi:hypothetical protein
LFGRIKVVRNKLSVIVMIMVSNRCVNNGHFRLRVSV